MQDNNASSPRRIFIVTLDDFLVARDIEMMIHDMRPEVQVVVARSFDDALFHAADARIETAFVQCDAARVLASPLGARVLRDGGHIVLVGQEPAEVSDGLSVLPFPFGQKDIALLFAGVSTK